MTMVVMLEPVVFGTLNIRGPNSKQQQYRLSRLVVEEQTNVSFLFFIQERKMMRNSEI